jgi:ABC-type lipoprotein release transport system permease subunit
MQFFRNIWKRRQSPVILLSGESLRFIRRGGKCQSGAAITGRVLTGATERRTKEIGIRKAMGAGTGDIVRLLVWQFIKPVIWANAVAWPIAGFLMNRWLHGFAYHVELEPWLFLAATSLALLSALITVGTQSYLVAKAKPIAALRYE